MFLCKGGVTVEAVNPSDIKRFKELGFIETKIGYPHPEVVEDGVQVKEKPAKKAKSVDLEKVVDDDA